MDSAMDQNSPASSDSNSVATKPDTTSQDIPAAADQADTFTFQSANALADSNKADSLSLADEKENSLWSAPLPAPAPAPPAPAQQAQPSGFINSLDGDSWTWP